MSQIYFRSFNPVWDLRTLTGLPLDDTYFAFFLENTIPYQYQAVYTSPTGTPWANPIQLTAAGTLPVNVYFDPELVYRIEIRAGNTQQDALIWLIENYTPAGAGGDTPITSATVTSDNQITNPQFALINFISPLTVSGTNPSAVSVAPGWELVLVGTGTAVITQVPLNNADANPTNAPYALELNLLGWSSAYLRQRFQQNGMLWADRYVSTSITAAVNGANTNISATMVDSNGTLLGTLLPSSTLVTTAYQELTGNALFPAPSNPDIPPSAWVEYRINFLGSMNIFVTSVQVLNSAVSAVYRYEQDTIDRQIDYTFHYYKPQLEFKPIPSLLTGWDFSLNPSQEGATVTMNTQATTPKYLWDQTIGASLVGNIAIVRNAVTGGIQATTANNNEAFYLMQYLSGEQAKKMLNTTLSSNISAWRTQAGSAVTVKVFLYRGSSAASFPTLPTGLGTVAANGGFTLSAANWTIINRGNLGAASGTLSTVDTTNYATLNDVVDLSFNGWEITNASEISNTDKFAIVVTYSCPTTGTIVTTDSISVVPGDIATRPAPQSADEVLRECQYYFERSYTPGVATGTVTTVGERYALNELGGRYTGGTVTTDTVYLQSFSVVYDQIKRTAVTPTFYSPASASAGLVQGRVLRNGADIIPSGAGALGTSPQNYAIAKWTFTGSSTKGVVLICNDTSTKVYDSGTGTPGNDGDESMMLYHYVANARIAVV